MAGARCSWNRIAVIFSRSDSVLIYPLVVSMTLTRVCVDSILFNNYFKSYIKGLSCSYFSYDARETSIFAKELDIDLVLFIYNKISLLLSY